MIIWGSGSGVTTLGELGERDCPVCDKRAPFMATLSYTYRHIWYVVSWVSGREYYAACGNCGNGTPLDKGEAKATFPKDGIPFIRKNGWLVAVVLFLGFLGTALMGNAEVKDHSQMYLSTPQVGDMYLANLASIPGSGYGAAKKAYGFMTLLEVKGEDIVLAVSKEAYSKKSGVRKALQSGPGPEAFDMDEPLTISLTDAQKFFSSRVIYEIRRP